VECYATANDAHNTKYSRTCILYSIITQLIKSERLLFERSSMFSIVLRQPRIQGPDVKAEDPVTQCIVLRPARCNLGFGLHKQLS
jgi:hypothetical protein